MGLRPKTYIAGIAHLSAEERCVIGERVGVRPLCRYGESCLSTHRPVSFSYRSIPPRFSSSFTHSFLQGLVTTWLPPIRTTIAVRSLRRDPEPAHNPTSPPFIHTLSALLSR